MRRFEPVDGVAALLDQDNIDTDQILPSAYMRGVDPDYAAGLFALWRRDLAFILSRPGWQQSAILVSGTNFGCGSTREHAVWALDAFGIRVLIAGSYGEVFRDNCVKNGILPIVAAVPALERLRHLLRGAAAPLRFTVDLAAQSVRGAGFVMEFDIPASDKMALLEGLDEIGLTLQHDEAIARWERREATTRPWHQRMKAPA